MNPCNTLIFKDGFFTWEIQFLDMTELEKHGDTDFEKLIVRIDSTDLLTVQRETLLHELLHVSMWNCSALEREYDKRDEREEDIILHTSPRLMHILNDNQRLRDFLFCDDE